MKRKFNRGSFSWQGVTPTTYADEHTDSGGRSWLHTARHIIKGREGGGLFDVRYFELSPGGFTSLECHEHIHSVICVRGEGYAIVGQDLHEVGEFDHILVPPNTAHQFVNSGAQAFGFLCIVDSDRDRPRALTTQELNALQANPAIAAKIKQ